MKLKHSKMKFYLSVWIIIIAIHCTDVKVSIIKVTEIFFLIYMALHIRKLCGISKWFLRFFTVFLFITFAHNLFLNFDYSIADNILKQPYWCSIGRYLEVLACLSFLEFVRRKINRYGFHKIITHTLKFNFYFSILILLLYAVDMAGGLQTVSYNEGRLKGLFVEGGPFGLLYAVLTLLSIFQKRPMKETVLLSAFVILSRSKAGICCLSAYFAIKMVLNIYKNKRYRKFVIFGCVMFISAFLYVFLIVAKMYIEQITDVSTLEAYVNNNPYDYSAVAGRVPATFIVYAMFWKHPLIGIGIGNYPILRNMSAYRGFFPQIDIYDATGYGGIIDILNQCGMIGLTLFGMYMYKQIRKSNNNIYIIFFILPLLFGVQYTFMYPWFMLALHSYTIAPYNKNSGLMKKE